MVFIGLLRGLLVVLWLKSLSLCFTMFRSRSLESASGLPMVDALRRPSCSGDRGGLEKSWVKDLEVGEVTGEASGEDVTDEPWEKQQVIFHQNA
jgi:hypothetical protein